MRLSFGALVGALVCGFSGCCLNDIRGIATSGTGTGGQGSSTGVAATSSAASSSSTSSTSTSSGTSGTTASTGTTGGTSSGSSSGTSGSTGMGGTTGTSGATIIPQPPALLLDAGADTIFGPVAMTAVPQGGTGVARLVYAEGDGGQYGIMLRTLDSTGHPLGDTLQLATTGDQLVTLFGQTLLYPFSPPDVTVADDGDTTTVCWDDYATVSNPDLGGACASSGSQEAILCTSVPDDGGSPTSVYSNCGKNPQLVFNPTTGSTQLFFLELMDQLYGLVEWVVGQATALNQLVYDGGSALVGVALPDGRAAVIAANHYYQPPGLWLASTGFADGGYLETDSFEIQSNYTNDESYSPTPFAAGSEPGAGTAAILWFDGLSLRVLIWRPDTPDAGSWVAVPSEEPLDGAIAVGICPTGYAFLGTTIRGNVLFAEGTFDGGVDLDPNRYIGLLGFDSTPQLIELSNEYMAVSAMSLATATAPGGKMLFAISNPWQLAVYEADCE